MLHIFLMILKIPLILLAILLLLLAAAVLLVLFVPVRYQARLTKEDQLVLSGRVHWLLHLLSVRADYREKKPDFSVRLCGILLAGGNRKKDEDGDGEAGAEIGGEESAPDGGRVKIAAAHVQEEMPQPELMQEDVPQSEPVRENTPQSEPARERQRARTSLWERMRAVRDRGANTFRRLLEKIKNIRESVRRMKAKLDSFLELWYDEHTQMAIRHGKAEIFYILKHYLPGNVQGRLLLGLSDPAATGQVLGLLCIVQVFTGNHLQVEADFERAVLEGDVSLKGHVRLCHLIKSGLSLLLDRHCRTAFARFRKFTSNGKNK